MYRITYEVGNGYSCGCCRRTYEETEDLETKEEVYEWLLEFEIDQQCPRYTDADDREIVSIEKEFGEDIQDEFVLDQKTLTRVVEAAKQKKEEKKVRKDKARREEDKAKELAQLRRLVAKYPDAVQK